MTKEKESLKTHGIRVCNVCKGDGYVMFSCCGDDLKPNIGETDLCPSCHEHCGEPEEVCEECYGTGGFVETTADEFNKEVKKDGKLP